MSPLGTQLRRFGPPLVSLAILVVLALQLDLGAAAQAVDAKAAGVIAAALVAYGGVSLAIEARSLTRLLPGPRLSLTIAARVKAASYLLAVLHYALGMGALSVLLRRRAQIDLGVSAGVVLLIAALDLGVLIACCLGAVTLLEANAAQARMPVVAGAALAMIGGFVLVRTPRSLGPLDRLRSLSVFRALATTPLPALVEVAAWRMLFVGSFVALVDAALAAFGIAVPVGDLVIGVTISSLVASLPIAVAGLGTGQAAFLYVFRGHAPPETLLACSLLLSAGLILMRALIGALFAREYAREARAAMQPEGARS